MKKLRSRLYEVYGGLQACTFCIENESACYLNAILNHLKKKKKNTISSKVLSDVEKYCPGFLKYLSETESFNVEKHDDKIVSFTMPEIGKVQVIYKE